MPVLLTISPLHVVSAVISSLSGQRFWTRVHKMKKLAWVLESFLLLLQRYSPEKA